MKYLHKQTHPALAGLAVHTSLKRATASLWKSAVTACCYVILLTCQQRPDVGLPSFKM